MLASYARRTTSSNGVRSATLIAPARVAGAQAIEVIVPVVPMVWAVIDRDLVAGVESYRSHDDGPAEEMLAAAVHPDQGFERLARCRFLRDGKTHFDGGALHRSDLQRCRGDRNSFCPLGSNLD